MLKKKKTVQKKNARRYRDESLRLLVASVRDYAIFLLDPNGYVMTWNAGAEHIKGYRADEIVGKHFSTFYPLEERGKCDGELKDALRDGRFEDEGWRLRKDGTRFWANVIITPVFDEGNQLLGFAKVTRDLTERIRNEREHMEMAREQEAAKRKQEFLAVVGHELRNPLSPMVTVLQNIKLRGGQVTPRDMEVMERQLQHMHRLVDDLLDATRSLQGKMRLNKEVFDVSASVAHAVEMCRVFLESRGHQLTVDCPIGKFFVDADKQRLAQVIGNLLDNAGKYTAPGGKVHISVVEEGPHVKICVRDNGSGISQELLPRIFNFFEQGAQGAERSLGGLGIGLGLAKQLMKQQDGTISATSEIGKGSVFTVCLPAAQKNEASDKMHALSPPVATMKRILVVDDSADAGEMLQTYLQLRGYDVRVAADGFAAIQTWQEFQPSVVVMDIGLPGMTGYELAVRLRELSQDQELRLIALSGYARDLEQEKIVPRGFSAHLHKPVDLATLERHLE